MATATAEPIGSTTTYLTPDQVCEIIPGMTRGNLSQLRFKGIGPTYYKPTPRVVLYDREGIEEWVRSSARNGTADR